MELGSGEASLKEIATARPRKRMDALLRKVVEGLPETEGPKVIESRFLCSPLELLPEGDSGGNGRPSRVGGMVVERTRLEGEPNAQRAVSTGEAERISCELVLRSIGYKSTPLEGVPFDDAKHVAANVNGRTPLPGLYTSGWLKRGPNGIIGTNITDASWAGLKTSVRSSLGVQTPQQSPQ